MSQKESFITVSQQLKDQTTKDIFDLKGPRPNLAILIIGREHEYFENIKKLEQEAVKVGVDTHLYICDPDTNEQGLIEIVDCLNQDDLIDAIYVQRPLISNISLETILERINPEKDVNFAEEFVSIDWDFFEARLFKHVFEIFTSSKKIAKEYLNESDEEELGDL